VENRFGLRPAVIKDANQIAPITAMRDLDTQGWLANAAMRTVNCTREPPKVNPGDT